MSVVPLLAQKPQWFSERYFLVMVGMILLSWTLASTLPAMESRVIIR